MDRIITWGFGENFIEKLSVFLYTNFLKRGNDLSRVACVFGGKRPALFLKRELAKGIKSPFYPPQVFSIDEFIEYIVSEGIPLSKISNLDASFLIYKLCAKLAPQILKGRNRFNEFLPWAQEIFSFIEQLDLEDIHNQSLGNIQRSAAIGYDIPQNINLLLQHIIKIRSAYHASLNEKRIFSRGLLYLRASHLVRSRAFNRFEAIVFCNFFYLHTTEAQIIKEIYKKGRGICIFQGNEGDWSVLKDNVKSFNIQLPPPKKLTHKFSFSLYAGYDLHSQVCIVRQILTKIKRLTNTVIVLPRSESLLPLLSEISQGVGDFNVSLGYSLKRSPLFALFNALFVAQKNKKDRAYYARDYLKVLSHPLIKNIRFSSQASSVTRVLAHKIEEVLRGRWASDLGGTLFVRLDAIENLPDIYSLARDTLKRMNIRVSLDELRQIVKELNRILFCSWEEVKDFSDFTRALDELIRVLVQRSMVVYFPFNLKVIERLYSIKEEFQALSFSKERFSLEEISAIFLQRLEREIISFVGSPLRGLQILGLLETRSLDFENVIVIDVNEGALPKLKIYEPLIPREIMLSLGLNRLEKEEEIQRYQFMRLISSAKNVHLVYEESEEKERSRFIEELLWKKQKQLNKLEVIPVPKASFTLKMAQAQEGIKKTKEMIGFLKKETYSASRINTYLNCPLQFYYQYILGLSEREDLLDEPEAREVGTFIHQLLEEAFKKFLNKKPVIDKKFRKRFFSLFQEKFIGSIAKRMRSDSFLLKGIIEDHLKRFLDREEERGVEKILGLEEEFAGQIKLMRMPFEFIAKVDRIDEYADGSIVIIDYKTGTSGYVPKKLEQLETMELSRQAIKENIKSFQLPLYYYFVKKHFPIANLNAELYNLRRLERKSFISPTDYRHKEKIMGICLKALEFVFRELFDPDIAFEADRDERKCKHCAFISLCR